MGEHLFCRHPLPLSPLSILERSPVSIRSCLDAQRLQFLSSWLLFTRSATASCWCSRSRRPDPAQSLACHSSATTDRVSSTLLRG